MTARRRAVDTEMICSSHYERPEGKLLDNEGSHHGLTSIREAHKRRAVPGDEAPAGRRIAVAPTD